MSEGSLSCGCRLYLSALQTQPPGSFLLTDRPAKDSCCQATGGSGGIHSRELRSGVAHTYWGTDGFEDEGSLCEMHGETPRRISQSQSQLENACVAP